MSKGSRAIVLARAGTGSGASTRFPWARSTPRVCQAGELLRYRCERCAYRFRLAGRRLPCPECVVPALAAKAGQ